MICSTLSGKVAIKHPALDVLVREDGAIFVKDNGNRYSKKYHWTFGTLHDRYLRVWIKGKCYNVHRLVAEAFIPNPENKPTVDHINRIKTDNRVSNLRWATYKEQVENSGQYEKNINGVFNRDDPNAYARARRAANPEHYHEINRRSDKKRRQEKGDEVRAYHREYMRKYRAARKQQKAAQ